ncbi:hypothetical protein MUCCIDRAFT_163114 [Mucor lusitanicus CBS 277.49]|uniref:Uncharacterized protein n=1 Tax=Mucor lusitanicus CBS 277.49 TaxID=747725 RepID=A0A168LHX8_MUCCL|nr:hypothetical protein MUCCIDRAFT_163114 [Mucor lusitanicus CBS 277.49]
MASTKPITEYSKLYDRHSVRNDYQKVPLLEDEWAVVKDQAHIINAGGSIWGLDFVPKPSSDKRSDQYLAIGGYNTTTEHHLLCEDLDVENRLNAIQIWKCKSLTSSFTPTLDMCILHDFGVVVDFKWCLFSVYDNKKLGILAAMFNNGIVQLFVVPQPQYVRKKHQLAPQDTLYIKASQARLELKLPNTKENSILCFAWGGYRKLACGTRSGSIVIWDVLESLLQKKGIISPAECTLYELIFDDESKSFKYKDGFQPKTTPADRDYLNVLQNPIIALHKIAWNPNKNACGWVASGGAAGLCRLEYTGL